MALNYATWDPNNKGTNVTLSGGNLVASSSIGSQSFCSSDIGVISGKWYWEYTITASGGNESMHGVADATAVLTNSPGQDVHGYGYYASNGNSFHNATLTAYGATYAVGDVIGVALDVDNNQVTFYKNGVSQGVITMSGMTAPYFAASGNGSGAANTVTVTANFGASAFAGSVPGGYNAGLYVNDLFNEPFTGTNGTNVDGFNSWTAKNGSNVAITDLQIQTNQAAKTASGTALASHTVNSWTGVRGGKITLSRYSGVGLRFINYLVMGTNSDTSEANFLNNSMALSLQRSDSSSANTGFYVLDGATTVVSNLAPGWQLDGSNVLLTFYIKADGSGAAVFRKPSGPNTTLLTWGARSWTNGGNTMFGFDLHHNGSDGTGEVTLQQADDFAIYTYAAAAPVDNPGFFMLFNK